MRIKKPKSHHEAFFLFPVLSEYRVIIVLTDDIPASVMYLADRDFFNVPEHQQLTDCLACHLHPGNRGHSYIVLKPKAHAGAIAHETWHMIYNLMKFTGIELEDEFIAYHLGYAVQQIVQFQYEVQRRTQDADSGGSSPQAGAGGVGRSDGNSSKPKDQRIVGVHDTPKVRRGKTRTRQTHR